MAFKLLAKFSKRKLFLALVIIVILLVWILLLLPSLHKIPETFFYKADVLSTDNFYNEQTKEFSGDVLSKTLFSYEVISVKDNVLII